MESAIDACAVLARLAPSTSRDTLSPSGCASTAEFLRAKRGLVPAIHSGDPAYTALSGYFLEKVGPALTALLQDAAADGAARDDICAHDVLDAIANLCTPVPAEGPAYHHRRMVAVFIDGLLAPAGGVEPGSGH